MMVIGVDTHKREHALSAVDEGTGRVRGSREIKADEAGHQAAVRWARGLDSERVWAIEDCRHVSRRLEQALLAAGERVIRVAPRMMGASRRSQRERGKSDEIDAQSVARAVVKDGVESFPAAYLDERAMEIRLLFDHREDLVRERTRMQNRLRWHLLELCPELEAKLKRGALSQLRALERLDRRLRQLSPGVRLRIAREELGHIRALTREADQLERELLALIRAYRPALLDEQGCGALTAALLIGRTAGAAAVPLRRLLRPPVWHRADPLLLGAARPAPARSRRGPPAQPGAAHDRDHPRPTRPGDQGVLGSQRGRRQDQEGRAALPEALPRAPLLPPALRAATTRRTTYQRRAGPRASPAPRRPGGRRVARHVALGSADRDPRTSSPEAADPAHQRRTEPDDLYRLATRDSITASLPAGG